MSGCVTEPVLFDRERVPVTIYEDRRSLRLRQKRANEGCAAREHFSRFGRAETSLRPKSIFASAINPITSVQPCREKYSAFLVGQISELNPAVSPE